MKNLFRNVLVVLAMMLFVLGCKETEEEFVTRAAGEWDVLSKTSKRYDNDTVVYDRTRTDSLGTMEFMMTGQGFRTDGAGVRDTFVWGLSSDDTRLIVNYKIGPIMDATISDQTDNAMTLTWTESWNEDITHVKVDNVATFQRR